MPKNKYDVVEEYISSLQQDKKPDLKDLPEDPEMEQVLYTAKRMKSLTSEAKKVEVEPEKKRILAWILAPAVTCAVFIIGIVLYKQQIEQPTNLSYEQEMNELAVIEQDLDQTLAELDYFIEMKTTYQEIEDKKYE